MSIIGSIAGGGSGSGSGGGVSGLTTADAGTAIADNRVVRGDGATGIQGSPVDITDAGVVSGITQLTLDTLRFSAVAGAPEILRSGAAVIIRDNDGTFTSCIIQAGAYSQQGGAASFFRGVQVSSGQQIAFSDGTDFNRGLAAVTGAAGVRITNGSTGIGFLEASREVEANTAVLASPNLLLATESRKLITNEGATAENYHALPSAAAGLEFVFYCQDTDGIRVVASAGDTIRLGASVSAAAGFVRSVAAGSCITLVAINATEWIATTIVGTWTVDV